MLSGLSGDQERVISCVAARVGETRVSRLAIADIIADHRPAPAASSRAAGVFACLPGCSVFLALDDSGGYLAFMRDGACLSIRCARTCGHMSAAAEACAFVLYAWACAGQVPPIITVIIMLPDACGPVTWFAATLAVVRERLGRSAWPRAGYRVPRALRVRCQLAGRSVR